MNLPINALSKKPENENAITHIFSDTFNKKKSSIRSVLIDSEAWFVGKDVAAALGYSDTDCAIRTHVDIDDKAKFTFHDGRQNRNMVCINESGIKTLVQRSRLDHANALEVLEQLGFAESIVISIRQEHVALGVIEQLLDIKLIRQHQVDGYRVDGYHEETNTVYEVDESHHFVVGELKQECKDRQAYIESKLGCKFVRIKV